MRIWWIVLFPRDDPTNRCIYFFCMILNGQGSFIIHFTIPVCLTLSTLGITRYRSKHFCFPMKVLVLISTWEDKAYVKHGKRKNVFKNDKNINHFKVEKDLNICICNRKKLWVSCFGFFRFFFSFEKKDAEKGTALAKYCTLEHQSFSTQ